jgi:ribose 1,5-bisphosphokinase PhnN
MRKREREEKTTTQKVHRTNNGGSEVKCRKRKRKRRFRNTRTREAFSALRDARGVGVAGVGVACRAWLEVGLVVVVAMSLSLFTEHTG